MAIGVEGDPERLRDLRLGDIEVVHNAHDRAGSDDIVGGFSLRPVVRRGYVIRRTDEPQKGHWFAG
ncbi:MAG TPA: hypothetical protein VGJ56_04590 [Reyranella sp.]|jgi:hypothetical protein